MINLIHGEAIEEMKKLPDNSVDFCLTDPPYGTTQCKWDIIIPFEPMWKELQRIVKPNGAICLFGCEPFSSCLRVSNLKIYKYDWVWDKVNKFTGALNANKMPMRDHELISVFYRNPPIYNKQLREGEYKTRHGGNRNTESTNHVNHKRDVGRAVKGLNPKMIISLPSHSTKKSFHPTMKPQNILEYLIKTYSLESGVVLDFAMGSGSTGVACRSLSRDFIGIEKEQEYFEIAKKRIELF